jgi:hypothetical protein
VQGFVDRSFSNVEIAMRRLCERLLAIGITFGLSMAIACRLHAVTSTVPKPTPDSAETLFMRPDQVNTAGWDGAWTNLLNDAEKVEARNSDHVKFVLPMNGVPLSPGQTYWLRLTGGATFGWQYVVAGDESSPESATAEKTPELSPGALVRTVVANEVAAADHPKALHLFRSHRKNAKGTQTRLYVETKDALAAMLIAINDRPLTAAQQQGEINHLAWLAGNPEQLRKKAAREKEDEERSLRIVKALPDAFLYEYAGTENGEAALGVAGSPLVKLTFKPNPSYSPPSRVEEVLRGMQGELLIDKSAGRMALIDATMFREVTFGWGIIGHLNKGSHFRVQQGNLGLGDDEWGITAMSLNITGRILLFKGISLVSDEVFSDFQKMPENLTFVQAVEILKSEEEKLAHEKVAPENHTP